MGINIKRAAAYVTSDGKSHNTRKEALSHEKFGVRIRQLTTVIAELGALFRENDIEFIAKNGDAFVEALTVKQARKPRTPSVTQAPAA